MDWSGKVREEKRGEGKKGAEDVRITHTLFLSLLSNCRERLNGAIFDMEPICDSV
jgi:hypothetical protein